MKKGQKMQTINLLIALTTLSMRLAEASKEASQLLNTDMDNEEIDEKLEEIQKKGDELIAEWVNLTNG